jgi:hypothetical protein
VRQATQIDAVSLLGLFLSLSLRLWGLSRAGARDVRSDGFSFARSFVCCFVDWDSAIVEREKQ